MSEKRKPELSFDAWFWGKSGKKKVVRIELYPANLWPMGESKVRLGWRETKSDVYRLRVNGKWWQSQKTFTLSQFFAIFRRTSISIRKNMRRKQNLKQEGGDA